MQNTFFHVAPILMEVGSTIVNGNWGRIIRKYNRNNAGEVLYREHILELVRAESYPDKPSRLNSIFLLPTIDEARKYKHLLSQWGVIYEVEIDPNVTIHIGNYQKVIPLNNQSLIDNMLNCANEYWANAWTGDFLEVLYPQPVKIVRVFQDSF